MGIKSLLLLGTIIFAELSKSVLANIIMGPINILSLSNGAPVVINDTRTLNRNLINNANFMENIAQLVRERIPERIVHAKGTGVFGYFEVTRDMSHICKAKLFNGVGKKTRVAVRFSPVIGEKGGIDTLRDLRGFSIKFYTEEGNFDLLCLNTPVFAIKDPFMFPNVVHAFKRNPVNNLFDLNMFWDLVTLRPETFFMLLNIFGDGGIPDGYRHMPGFAIHTFQVVNQAGEIFFIRFHFLPDAGIRNLFTEEALRLAAIDPDYSTRDLYNAIENGDYPSWTLSIQIVTLHDARNAEFNIYDVTKVLPIKKYPLHEVGRLILNKNPSNHFAEVEQLAFNPGHLVPGINGAPDKIFESRRFAYKDALNYRLGVNFNKIPINCPIFRPLNYLRDGISPVNDNGGGAPNYYPNTFNGPAPYHDDKGVELVQIFEDESYNFEQAREFYVSEISEEERKRLVQNIVLSVSQTIPRIQSRVIYLANLVHRDLGNRIYHGLQQNSSVTFDCGFVH